MGCLNFCYAQQEVNFYNFSNYEIKVSYIVTTANADMDGTDTLQLMSENGFLLDSNSSYSAIDGSTNSPFKFPFNDFAGINNWIAPGVGQFFLY